MAVWGSSSGPNSVPVVVYRLVSVGLGSAPVGSDGLGGLVQGRKHRAHQCARDEGSVAGSSCLLAPAVRPECRPDERQCLGCCLSLVSERHGVSGSVCHGL